jgi:Domain of unknown function (DUF4278)
MTWWFIIPLAIGLLMAYFWKKAPDELGYLVGSAMIFALLLSIILAPWQIKIALLIPVVFSSSQLFDSSPTVVVGEKNTLNQEENKQTPQFDTSQLTYRGSHYKPTPEPGALTPTEIKGKYRGGIWTASPIKQETIELPEKMKYRGASVNNSVNVKSQEKHPSLS